MNIKLENVEKSELKKFKKDLQDSFYVAISREFGEDLNWPLPSDYSLEKSFNKKGAVIYHIVLDDKKVGGVVLDINEVTNHNSLEFFFIKVGEHSKGIGLKTWQIIEEKYPKTKVWETHTPYFEKRNIHFYVNKCGFRVVEFFNEFNKLEDAPDFPGGKYFLRFEKVMKN